MNNSLKVLAAIVTLSLLTTACNDDKSIQDLNYTPETKEVTKPSYDTEVNIGEQADTTNVVTIDLTGEVDSSEIFITLNSSGVVVDAPNYSAEYKRNDYNRVTIAKSEDGVKHMKVDNTTMFYSPKTKYIYLDANTIEVQPGNTLLGIVRDHKMEGYVISLQQIINCNPYLNNRGKAKIIYPGDRIRLECR